MDLSRFLGLDPFGGLQNAWTFSFFWPIHGEHKQGILAGSFDLPFRGSQIRGGELRNFRGNKSGFHFSVDMSTPPTFPI